MEQLKLKLVHLYDRNIKKAITKKKPIFIENFSF